MGLPFVIPLLIDMFEAWIPTELAALLLNVFLFAIGTVEQILEFDGGTEELDDAVG